MNLDSISLVCFRFPEKQEDCVPAIVVRVEASNRFKHIALSVAASDVTYIDSSGEAKYVSNVLCTTSGLDLRQYLSFGSPPFPPIYL